MDDAGAFVVGLHIVAIAVEAVAIGALVYLIWRIEHWRKTFDSLLRGCERLASKTSDSAAP